MDIAALTRRVGMTVVATLVGLSALHAVMYLLPGDPVRALFGLEQPDPALLAELRAAFGLDRPYPVQLADYLTGLVTGDLGPIYRLSPNGLSPSPLSVGQAVGAAAPTTLTLALGAVALQLVVGVPLAVALADAHRTRWRVQLLMLLTALLVAVPGFVLANAAASLAPGVVRAARYAVGVTALAAAPVGMIALVGWPEQRVTHAGQAVRRAKAAGIPPWRIRWLHALRLTMAPMVALAAANTGLLLATAVVVEPAVGLPGVGALLTQALDTRQGPLTLAILGLFLIVVSAVNLLADVLTGLLDRRTTAV